MEKKSSDQPGQLGEEGSVAVVVHAVGVKDAQVGGIQRVLAVRQGQELQVRGFEPGWEKNSFFKKEPAHFFSFFSFKTL